MLDESYIDLILAFYSIISFILFLIMYGRRGIPLSWVFVALFMSIASILFFFRHFDYFFRILGNLFYTVAGIILGGYIIRDYIIIFKRKENSQNNIFKQILYSVFILSVNIVVINSIQIFLSIFLLSTSLMMARILMKRPSVTHLFMLLSQISGFLTLFFSILKNFNIEGAWETAYLIKIVFHTSFLVTVLTAPTESKLKNSERKYRTSYNRAEFYKDIFAHDVNNIFHNILAAMDLCSLYLDRLNNEKIIEIIELVRDQISKGGELVSNIKKLSEIKDYQGTLDFIKVDRYVRQCIKDVKQKYKQKQIKIQLETLDQDYWVKANKWLSDIFENILINAIEHNENDRIEIIIKVSKAKIKDVDYIKFEFIDNGPGIPKKMKLKVFQRAFGRKKDYFGLGLGLSLVKKIIENYNGYVWIEDRVKGDHSKGSNFVVLIPAV